MECYILENCTQYCRFHCKTELMKKYLFVVIAVFFAAFSNGQKGYGFDLGFATSKSPMASFIYFRDNNAFSLGFSYEFNNTLGRRLKEKLSYFEIGHGDYFLTADAGYTRIFSEKFSLEGEVSVGERKYYKNYSDNTFPQGGYHVIYKKKAIVGLGAIAVYNFNDIFGVFGGLNTIRIATIGVQMKFVQ